MKSLLTTLFSLIILSAGFSQDIEETETNYPTKGDSEFGVLFGLYSGFVSENGFTNADGTGSIYNIGFGVQYDYYFSKTWSIRGRLNYDPKGANNKFTGLDLNATYVSIPVLANWHFGKRKRWYLHFGPYVAFLLSADVDGMDFKNQLDSSEMGTDIAIGVKIPVGNTIFFIENDTQNDFTSAAEGGENKFVRWTLTLGVNF